MLTREFYLRDARTVAEELLGKLLIHRTEEGVTAGMIVETEAYAGPEDKGAHSYGGLRSSRTEVMFGKGGHAYIYLIYGMYCCFNVVANRKEKPEAVLVRALEPVEGIDLMLRRQAERQNASRRGRSGGREQKDGAGQGAAAGPKQIASLCSGPGKLCVAMGLTKDDYGLDLCGNRLFIQEYQKVQRSGIYVSPRINIDYAEEYRDVPWRYYIAGNASVSRVAKKYSGSPLVL